MPNASRLVVGLSSFCAKSLSFGYSTSFYRIVTFLTKVFVFAWFSILTI